LLDSKFRLPSRLANYPIVIMILAAPRHQNGSTCHRNCTPLCYALPYDGTNYTRHAPPSPTVIPLEGKRYKQACCTRVLPEKSPTSTLSFLDTIPGRFPDTTCLHLCIRKIKVESAERNGDGKRKTSPPPPPPYPLRGVSCLNQPSKGVEGNCISIEQTHQYFGLCFFGGESYSAPTHTSCITHKDTVFLASTPLTFFTIGKNPK
jgi:hypothetical protein